MKAIRILAIASVTGVVAASAVANPAFAWHPKGEIKKFVQNQTTGSSLSDANTKEAAVAAKPGDTLKYVIEVKNSGANGTTNEMHYTKLTDTLPAGVQLIADPAKRVITEDLGVIKPGEKKTKEYLVKVTSSKDGDLIENKACFTGDSEVKDNPQDGCDVAITKVNVPPKPEEPKPEPPKPEQPKPQPEQSKPQTPQPTPAPAVVMPETGASAVIAPIAAFATGAAAYAGRLLVIKRRQK